MVFVQDLLGIVDGAGFLGALLPWHGEQPVDVIAADGRLGGHGRHSFELLQFLDGLVEHFLGHAGGVDLLAQLVELALFAAAQLFLDGLDLLVEVVLFLRALHLPLDARLDVAVEVELFDFHVEHVGNARKAGGGVEDAEKFLLFLNAELQVGGDDVGKLGRLVHAHGGDDGLVVERLLQLDVLLEEVGDALHQLLERGRHFELRLGGAHRGHKEAVAIGDVNRFGPLDPFHQHLDVAVGHLDALHDVADGADLVDFLGFGFVDGGVVLGGEEDLAVAVEGLFEGADAGLAADHEGGHHVGEDHHVPDGHHGQFARLRFVAGYGHWDTLGNLPTGNKEIRRAKRTPAAGRVPRLMFGLYSGSGWRLALRGGQKTLLGSRKLPGIRKIPGLVAAGATCRPVPWGCRARCTDRIPAR